MGSETGVSGGSLSDAGKISPIHSEEGSVPATVLDALALAAAAEQGEETETTEQRGAGLGDGDGDIFGKPG